MRVTSPFSRYHFQNLHFETSFQAPKMPSLCKWAARTH